MTDAGQAAALCERCGGPFTPRRSGRPHRFCSTRCQVRAWRVNNREAMATSRRGTYDRRRSRDIAQAVNRNRLNPPDRDKQRARRAVSNALRDGRLTRGKCEVGGDCEGRIEAHHEDYGKPLDVRWLCSKHHGSQHRKEGL